jgi:hypothetical protein
MEIDMKKWFKDENFSSPSAQRVTGALANKDNDSRHKQATNKTTATATSKDAGKTK